MVADLTCPCVWLGLTPSPAHHIGSASFIHRVISSAFLWNNRRTTCVWLTFFFTCN